MAFVHDAMLRAASRLVPEPQRGDWFREWSAELFYLLERDGPAKAIEFCAGAFRDAFVVRSQTPDVICWRDVLRVSSPGGCLAMLTLLAAAAALVMLGSPAVQTSVWERALEIHVVIAAAALLFYPMVPGARGIEARGIRGWSFLAAKCTILMVLVFFASFDIVPVISRAPMQPQLAFVMYILAYRWAIIDQRRRCPVCLRLLTSPVHIGHCAGTFLEWYGAELVCSKGHGVLHEPELPTSSYCTRRWVHFDTSWRELFQ